MPRKKSIDFPLSALLIAIILNTVIGKAFAFASDECTRSIPVPVFDAKQSGILSHRFVPISSHEAREYAMLSSGESLDIRLDGCEYFVVTIKVLSKRFSGLPKSSRDAYKVAATTLRRLDQLKDKSGFDLKAAAISMEDAAEMNSPPPFEEAVAVKGDGIDFLQAHVQLDAVGDESGVPFIQITLSRGPL